MIKMKMEAKMKTLFLIGTYEIGKERILEPISKLTKIFIPYQKYD